LKKNLSDVFRNGVYESITMSVGGVM
jgi:hypothetical protein